MIPFTCKSKEGNIQRQGRSVVVEDGELYVETVGAGLFVVEVIHYVLKLTVVMLAQL